MGCISENPGDELQYDEARGDDTPAVALAQPLRADELDALEDPSGPEDALMTVDITGGAPGEGRIERGASKRSKATQDELHSGKLPAVKVAPEVPAPKLSPDIPSTPMVDVVIRYVERDAVRLPRMPRLRADQARDSGDNRAVRDRAERLVQHVQALRADDHARHGGRLKDLGGRVKAEYWLLNALSATVPHDQLAALADDPDVESIHAAESGGSIDATVADGRAILNSDPYFNVAGINTGFIGILDTGTRRSHTQLNGRIDFWRDCVNGTSNQCTVAGSGLTLNPDDEFNHGTGVANVMSGTSNLGSNFRGVTGIMLDSFKIARFTIDSSAVIRGLQAALAASDDVINCSFGCGGTAAQASICSDAADSAFNSGAVVVATMGNEGIQRVHFPGEGHKVLTVGAIDSGRAKWIESNTGPTSDGRTKPDLVALGVSVDTATSFTNTSFASGSGTSFAAPFIAGGAALMRRWLTMAFPGVGIEPGYVAAMMIASGDNNSNPTSNFGIGAGAATMPTNATLSINKITVTNGVNQDTSITMPSGKTRIKVALWWPELRTQHNDIDLSLLTSSGSTITSSLSASSIWEKVGATVTAGSTLKIRARGFSVTGTQTVFVAAIMQ